MDLRWFRDLGHLRRTGHFSRAATLSHLSQPAFSRRIRALEAWVGAPLVDRARHPVTLTAAGLQMLEAGEQALERIETERRLVCDVGAAAGRAVVTFAAQHSIGWRFFPAWLRDVEAAFGPMPSRLRADDLSGCLAALEEGEADFVVAYTSAYAPRISALEGVESLVVGRDRLVPVCKPGPDGAPLFTPGSGPARPTPLLRFGPKAPISRHIDPVLAVHGLGPSLRVVYENAMAGALRVRARDGDGLAWLPESLVAPDLEGGLLTLTGEPDWRVPVEIRLHRLRQRTNRLTRALWSFLAVRAPAD